MKRILLFACSILTLSAVHGQQDKQFTHYMFDRMSYNPAATGLRGYCATLIYRNQWDLVERAPNTTTFSAQANFSQFGPGSFGAGLTFTNDAIGFMTNNTVGLSGAYHFQTSFGVLSGGLSLGIFNAGFDPQWVPPTDNFDANLPMAVAGTAFDMNAGLHFYTNDNKLFVGVSSTHLAPPSLEVVSFDVVRHYYVTAGYNMNLSDMGLTSRRIDLKPSVLVKADGATAIFDFNVMSNFWFNPEQYIWVGASYRLRDGIPLMIGYGQLFNRATGTGSFKFGYSFDIMTNPLSQYGRGTHELMGNVCLFPPPPVVPRSGNPFILQ